MSTTTRALVVIIGVGCNTPTLEPGNSELGIARFVTTETNELTTIVGLDSADDVVARVDLVHGRFRLGDEYEERAGSFDTGRKLTVSIAGETFEWETIGFTDNSQMPALPRELGRVTALLADEHVQLTL